MPKEVIYLSVWTRGSGQDNVQLQALGSIKDMVQLQRNRKKAP